MYLSYISPYISCNHLFISVLSCLSCCTCYLCIPVSVSIYPCRCVSVYCLSLSLSFIYLISIYILFIFFSLSFSLTPSPCAYHSHSIFISLITVISYFMVSFCPFIFFFRVTPFFFLYFSVSYSLIVFLADALISFIFLLPFWHWRLWFQNAMSKRHTHETDIIWMHAQPTLCWKPRQAPYSYNTGAFLEEFLASKLNFPDKRRKTLHEQLSNNLGLPSFTPSVTAIQFVCLLMSARRDNHPLIKCY